MILFPDHVNISRLCKKTCQDSLMRTKMYIGHKIPRWAASSSKLSLAKELVLKNRLQFNYIPAQYGVKHIFCKSILCLHLELNQCFHVGAMVEGSQC